jgi:hypothetical protein
MKKAMKFFSIAAEAGNPNANVNLGVMYQEGKCVTKDMKKAMKFFSIAAEAGRPSANFYLGMMYQEGDGVAKNIKKAMEFFTIAARVGSAEAAECLASLAKLGHPSSSVCIPSRCGGDQTPGGSDEIETTAHVCHACGAKKGLLRCGRCKIVVYCSVTCQREHWKRTHKSVCKQAPRGDASANGNEVEVGPTVVENEYSLQAGIDASIRSASDHTVSVNAMVSDAIMRTSAPDTETMAVAIMEFSQDGKWFASALSESPELESIRQPPLSSGAKVFIKPQGAFEVVVQYLADQGFDLKPRHVVVLRDDAQRVQDVIQSAFKSTPRKQRSGSGSCFVRSHVALQVPLEDPHNETFEDAYDVKHTFVHVPIPSSLWSELSAQAATV